jgi:hypothetical protein
LSRKWLANNRPFGKKRPAVSGVNTLFTGVYPKLSTGFPQKNCFWERKKAKQPAAEGVILSR